MSPLRAILLLALVVALVVPANAAAQTGATECPATFDVLHDDMIGKLKLEAGPYDVTVRGGLSCAEASDLFRQFLEDWDGRLPRPWRIDVATASFTRGRGGTVGFSVKRATSPHGGGGGGHHGALVCPAYFTVLHNDHIGSFAIPKGRYRITLVSAGRLTCAQASNLFARFLQDFDGVLPRPWFLDQETGTFLRGSVTVGFRIKPWSGTTTGHGGGGRHPNDGTRCPGTFRVLHNDRIGNLRLPKGPYYVTTLRGGNLSCSQASRFFTQFLNDPNGVLPRPWVLNTTNGTFRQGRGSKNGFRVKPASVR